MPFRSDLILLDHSRSFNSSALLFNMGAHRIPVVCLMMNATPSSCILRRMIRSPSFLYSSSITITIPPDLILSLHPQSNRILLFVLCLNLPFPLSPLVTSELISTGFRHLTRDSNGDHPHNRDLDYLHCLLYMAQIICS